MVVQYEDSSIGHLPFDAEMLVLEQGGHSRLSDPHLLKVQEVEYVDCVNDDGGNLRRSRSCAGDV